MALVEWMPSFYTKVAKIDEQHKVWVGLLNMLFDAYADSRGHEVLSTMTTDLRVYTEIHFATEQGIMTEAAYPRLAEHLKLHAELLSKVRELEENMLQGRRVLTREVIDFLNHWLTNHILKDDKAFGEFYQRQN